MKRNRKERTLYIVYMMINIYSTPNTSDYHNNNLIPNENQDIIKELNEDQDITDPNIQQDIIQDLIKDIQEVKAKQHNLFNIKNLIASVIVFILILVVWLCFFPKKLIENPNKEEILKKLFKEKGLSEINYIIPYLEYSTTNNIDLELFKGDCCFIEMEPLYTYIFIQRANNKTGKINIDKNNADMKKAKEIYAGVISNIKQKSLEKDQNINDKLTGNDISELLKKYLLLDSFSYLALCQGPNPNSGSWSGVVLSWNILKEGNYDIELSSYEENQKGNIPKHEHIYSMDFITNTTYTIKIVPIEQSVK